MNRWSVSPFVMLCCLLLFPQRCPAPLIYTPGEGWHYESVGEGSWRRGRAKDQLELAQAAFDLKEYGVAMKAARRTVSVWPFTDYAPKAQYLLARCYEAKGQDERAFNAYQKLIERYPKLDNFDEILRRQFEIANRFLAGKSFKLWGYIPFFPSMDKTIRMYEHIVKTGRYSEVAPQAQMNIAVAHEKKEVLGFIKNPDYPAAARAYEIAADRYSDQKAGVDALYKVGEACTKQAATAEYDQSVAGLAIANFTDFMTLHPDDTRVAAAQKAIDTLKTEQARGSFEIAKYYEKRHRWKAAQIYYNDAWNKDASSQYADEARRRIEAINKRLAP